MKLSLKMTQEQHNEIKQYIEKQGYSTDGVGNFALLAQPLIRSRVFEVKLVTAKQYAELNEVFNKWV